MTGDQGDRGGQGVLGAAMTAARLRELGQLLGEGLHKPSIAGERSTSALTHDELPLAWAVHVVPRRAVCGTGTYSLRAQWKDTSGLAESIHTSWRLAFDEARRNLVAEAKDAEALGVIGVDVDVRINPAYCSVVISGTAVESSYHDGKPAFPVTYEQPFLSNLSMQDFAALTHAGWYPRSLIGGAGFVDPGRQELARALKQARTNSELENLTQALQAARNQAMQELQGELQSWNAAGVVGTDVVHNDFEHSGRIMSCMVWGTSIWPATELHDPDVHLVLPLDDGSSV